ncbi:glucosamine-6-phosphate deaminase [Desemzia sp. RIT804]|uniref:glucosamine-6-phosphate deaminase n=1 Tax=Desemzia sp. RIT 804 TaxID=2810209 RepID=UPI00194F161A|nr:glucosamine-6-phosphate deaminase [Desemzia sp. RIT 804]MBM6613582.1 glucosamine-6-phosphate deaminase [Desemzia sp. RIT 804]
MELTAVKDYASMSKEAASLIIKVMQEHEGGLFCFAGGDTPVGTLKELVQAHKNGNIDLHKYHYVELDEWVGLGEEDEGSCIQYLNRYLFKPAEIPQKNCHIFNAKSENLAEECQRADEYIKKNDGLTLSLLGVGVNGHLGFNEPGVSFEQAAHVVDLQGNTKEVGKKYFNGSYVIDKGITLGINQLFASKYLILLANGETKKQAVEQLMKSDQADNKWPVTIVKEHSNSYAFIDDNLLH